MKRNDARYSKPAAASAVILASLVAITPQATAGADPYAYGPDTCAQGYVWREAFDVDHVCVTPAVRSQTARENATAAQRRDASSSDVPVPCLQGFVFREAFNGDYVCVTPASRAQAAQDNADEYYRTQMYIDSLR
jgi:hypothetical protein